MTLKNPILIFSEYCEHCGLFIEKLRESSELFKSFVFLNIDPDKNNNRPNAFYKIQNDLKFKIEEVPVVITINAEYILSGIEAFNWLEYETQVKIKEDKFPLEFNPNEMGSVSDPYSMIGNNTAAKQSYLHFGDPIDEIETPPPTETTYDRNGRNIDKEAEMKSIMEQKIQERNNLLITPKQIDQSRIDWNSGKVI